MISCRIAIPELAGAGLLYRQGRLRWSRQGMPQSLRQGSSRQSARTSRARPDAPPLDRSLPNDELPASPQLAVQGARQGFPGSLGSEMPAAVAKAAVVSHFVVSADITVIHL